MFCRECEANALQMSKLDFNDDSEKGLVEQVFGNAMESLADEDRQLPQVTWRTFSMDYHIALFRTMFSSANHNGNVIVRHVYARNTWVVPRLRRTTPP